MTTVLDKELRRSVTVGGAVYTVSIDPEGLRVTGKGRRKAEVTLRWSDLLNGDAALATALNASLMPQPARTATAQPPVTNWQGTAEEDSAAPSQRPAAMEKGAGFGRRCRLAASVSRRDCGRNGVPGLI